MKAVARKRGSSGSLRVPAAVLKAAKFIANETVNVREESGRVVIESAPRKEYDIAELVKGITRANLHEGIDFGRIVRRQAPKSGC